jgi:hypothetical protein
VIVCIIQFIKVRVDLRYFDIFISNNLLHSKKLRVESTRKNRLASV